jgi:hypothetical protein
MVVLIAAFVRPQAGEGAQIAISQDETTELAATMASISERAAALQNKIHTLSVGEYTTPVFYGKGRWAAYRLLTTGQCGHRAIQISLMTLS